ncbi:pyrroline-5-carboxylate reductase family protein [Methylacidiphilum caldifontis]|uniref:Pyrroline-5-carboxylate reductase n=1 Tax=Methylacidiphilum caldifontis TaxID=2795386 RepID=A0A4Y8PBQ8_9BACT|nr:pyrroline-5-carboxylate reductase [Methylacidiphilum caldifontis]QSR88169.1 pyrroline-5-carboxylate reductase [Methylacidiphilum caldifontis]TFE68208.1 pyrroline-5-carboxylate reductase [Methylacidiphilum caldifontis]
MELLGKNGKDKSFLKSLRVGFIGPGKMARALLSGLALRNERKWLCNTIWVSGRSKESLESFARFFEQEKVQLTLDNVELVKNTDLIFLCVKPFQAETVLRQIESVGLDKWIISVVAGLSIKKIKHILPHCLIVRTMPNLACQIGKGIVPFAIEEETQKNKQLVSLIHLALLPLGQPIAISEELMSAVTVLTGCGPAYICMLMIGLIEKAKAFGFAEVEAEQLIEDMVLGTILLLKETKKTPYKLLSEVKTPHGITEAAYQLMVRKGWEDILIEAIETANKKAEELESRL